MRLSALVECEHIAKQLRHILGESTYDELLLFDGMQIHIEDPVYHGTLPEEALRINVCEELPLDQCSPTLQAHVKFVMCM